MSESTALHPLFKLSLHELIGMTRNLYAWRPGWPPGMPDVIRQIDKHFCEAEECGTCGHVGLICCPYWCPLDAYRVFAVCPNCDNIEDH